MSELSATLVVSLDASAGTKKLKVFTMTPEANGDTVPLATWFSSIDVAIAFISAGMDANLTVIQGVVSSTTVTLTELKATGAAADDWSGAAVTLIVIGEDSAI